MTRYAHASLTWALVALSVAAWGQGVWDNPFESTLRTHERKAWTWSGGTSMLMGMPSEVQSAWVLNHGTMEAVSYTHLTLPTN